MDLQRAYNHFETDLQPKPRLQIFPTNIKPIFTGFVTVGIPVAKYATEIRQIYPISKLVIEDCVQ